MTGSDQEIEAKFFLRDLPALAKRLESLGGRISVPRVHEINLRFDTPDGMLTQAHRVLRLRQDAAAVLTYKGPAQQDAEVSTRQEIEVTVSDFAAAQRLLEALGYRVSVMYEKYRTTYDYQAMMITLDEMPFGSFVEIEGTDPAAIRSAAEALGLEWEARSSSSYLALFNHLVEALDLRARNLSFEELKGITVRAEDLGLRYSDSTS